MIMSISTVLLLTLRVLWMIISIRDTHAFIPSIQYDVSSSSPHSHSPLPSLLWYYKTNSKLYQRQRIQWPLPAVKKTLEGTNSVNTIDKDNGNNNDKDKDKRHFHPSSISKVGECIGSGSYGTVHSLLLEDYEEYDKNNAGQQQQQQQLWIGKRPWTAIDLERIQRKKREEDEEKAKTKSSFSLSSSTTRRTKDKNKDGDGQQKNNNNNNNSNSNKKKKKEKPQSNQERAQRCRMYWEVEEHCWKKLSYHPQLPRYIGRYTTPMMTTETTSGQNNDRGKETYEWMVFESVSTTSTDRVQSLGDYMKLDCNQHIVDLNKEYHSEESSEATMSRLPSLTKAMGCANDEDTLDTVFQSLLTVLEHVHNHNIVHRDVKPDNLLVDPDQKQLVLIDFGSAADLDPIITNQNLLLGKKKTYVGLSDDDERRVAVSPIYCAPEIFIDIQNSPLAFDVFSTGLLMCQLIFGYLEEREDAGFHQQLLESKYDLNLWLVDALGTEIRPEGLEVALEYLGSRPGLWSLLQHMLVEDPYRRPTIQKARTDFATILKQSIHDESDESNTNDDDNDEDDNEEESLQSLEEVDGPFFAMVLESLEICDIPTVSKPLHFVATFSRRESLGIVLSEKDDEDDDDDDEEINNDEEKRLWKEATKDAVSGEVFVKQVVPGGQADRLGIFEIGDRLQGIGELTFSTGGFERAVEMLQDQQPRQAQNVRLHFDRIRVRDNEAIPIIPAQQTEIAIIDQGVWSTRGRRQTQEDAFVLHEIHDTKDRSVLVMGVMDGHGGPAASQFVSEEFPTQLSNQVVIQRRPLEEAVKDTWDIVCHGYRDQCIEDDEYCVADYDAREGKLMAYTGSDDLIAGTTMSLLALDETTGQVIALNCGDSRSMIVGSSSPGVPTNNKEDVDADQIEKDGKKQMSKGGKVRFVTSDHTPQTEEERLRRGIIEDGLDYSIPQCRISKWTISAGRYEYAVGRSLEGPFVTSKGIVSDADVTTTFVRPGEILVSATDGLWEVMDTDEVALDLCRMRHLKNINARDAARILCSMAIDKGTSDNISAVVVYL